MPRQRGGAGGRRPAPAPAAKAPTQTRPSTTAAYPQRPAAAAPPSPAAQAPQQSSGGGSMLGNIASTAAGVAIGSSVGHAITGFFGGSSSPAETSPQQGSVQAQGEQASNNWNAGACNENVKQFTTCMDQNNGNMQICNWYLDQLKACQAAASQY